MTIERSFDANFFNEICNLPEVRPWLGGDGPIDVSPVVTNPLNYALRAEHGGFILECVGPGIYTVHSQFAAKGRGSTVAAMRAGFDFMFCRTDCMRIQTQIPDNNAPARNLAAAGGFRPWFRKEHDSRLGPSQWGALDVQDWIGSEAALEEDGRRFHDLLESAKAASGSELPTHDYEPAHERAVGAAVRMCTHGQARKGIMLYNLWARAAGYAPVVLLSDAPPVVDALDGVVAMKEGGAMEVVECR